MATYEQSNHGYILRLTVTETATNVETNKSTITYKLQLISGNVNHFLDFGVGATVVLDGTTVASRSRDNDPYLSIGFNSTLTLLSGSTQIAHNADGTKTISVGYTLNMASTSYTPGSLSGTGSFVCATIPRATTPTLSASSVNIGSSVTIYVTGRASDSFSHVLSYTIGSASGTIATLNTSTTSYSWTVPAALANQIPNAKSGTVSITCTTKSGSTTIGAKSVSLTITVPNTSTYQPSIASFTVTENNTTVSGLNLGSSYLVQGKSKITISGTPSAKYNATIKTTTYSVSGKTYSSGANISIPSTSTSNVSVPISMTATDSRGYSTTSSTTKTALPYSAPKISAMNFYRSDSSGTQDATGEYLHYVFTGAISSLNSKNTNRWAVHVQQRGTSTWTQVAIGTGYTLNVSGTSSSAILGVDNSYTARITLTDSFGSYEYTMAVSTGYTTVDYRSTGKGIAFGKASEIDAFECNMSEELRGQFRIWGDILFDNVAQTGQRVIRFGNDSGSTNHHDAAIVGGNPSATTGIGAYDFVNSAWIWQYKTATQNLSFVGDGQLTVTRTSNSYVSASGFSSVRVYRRSNLYIIRGHMELTTAMPNNTNWTEIGQISDYTALYAEFLSVPTGNGTGAIRLTISTDGKISVANVCGVSVSGYCGFSAAIVCA